MRFMIWTAIAACLTAGICCGDEPPQRSPPAPVPSMTAKVLPQPPQQDAAWTTPATKLPDHLISTVEFLFSDGCADPRGCEYRPWIGSSLTDAAELL